MTTPATEMGKRLRELSSIIGGAAWIDEIADYLEATRTPATEMGIEPLVERLRRTETRKSYVATNRTAPIIENEYEAAINPDGPEAADLIERLAATRTPEAAQWQTIETAPKDGSEVLVGRIVGVRVDWWHKAWWPVPQRGTMWKTRDGACQPTHWMPLPEPPALAQVRHPSGEQSS